MASPTLAVGLACSDAHPPYRACCPLTEPGDLHDLQLRRNQIQNLADILAHHAQIAAAIGAAPAGVELLPLARRAVGDPRAAPGGAIRAPIGRWRFRRVIALIVSQGRSLAFDGRDQQILQRQFQLLDLALDLFLGLAEHLLLQLGDAQPQGLDQLVVGAQGGRDLRVFRLQCRDQRLQQRRIIGKDQGHSRHASDHHKAAGISIKTSNLSRINQPTRAGGAPQSGLRQPIPSQSIANCAEVRRAAPSPCAGQGKRPFSSTL
jgi:hypothetical protein